MLIGTRIQFGPIWADVFVAVADITNAEIIKGRWAGSMSSLSILVNWWDARAPFPLLLGELFTIFACSYNGVGVAISRPNFICHSWYSSK